MLEMFKNIIGISTNEYDFYLILLCSLMVFYFFYNLLTIFKYIYDFIGGK